MFSCFGVECSDKVSLVISINNGPNQIGLRSVSWGRVAKATTKNISCLVTYIVPRINDKLCCVDPGVCRVLSHNVAQKITRIVKANKAWTEMVTIIWPCPVQEVKDPEERESRRRQGNTELLDHEETWD